MKSEERQLEILKQIVEIFIETGEPVSSLAICERLDKSVSSATIRNDMAKLERLGFLSQPHTSAGRIPTYKAFRTYVNTMGRLKGLSKEEKCYIDEVLDERLTSVSAIVENAAAALSEFTELAVVSTSDIPKFFVISKVDVIKTGKKIVAVLIVASSGEVKNKICRLTFDVSEKELQFFKRIINESLVGNTVEVLDEKMLEKLSLALGSYVYCLSPILKALYDISNEISKRKVDFKGESNLLRYASLKKEELLEFMAAKNKIEEILSSAFSGINIIFGKEDEDFVLGNSSLIVAKFGLNEPIGSLGVVGPLRINYKKILPYVSYFTKKISSLIEEIADEIEGGDGL